MKRWLSLILLVVVALLEAIAVHRSWVTGPVAVASFLVIEAALVIIALRKDPNHPIKKLIRQELRAWRTCYFLLCRRTDYPHNAIPMTSHRRWAQIPAMLSLAGIIEIAAVDLLVPSPVIRLILLVLSLYSLVLLWAFFAQIKVFPSYIHNQQWVLRRGETIIASFSTPQVAHLSKARGFRTDLHAISGSTLVLGSTEGTNCCFEFCEPILARAPRYPWQPPTWVSVTQCLMWIDDPAIAINRYC